MAMPKDLRELADLIDPARAQLFTAEVLAILGSTESWNGDDASYIDEAAAKRRVVPDGIPAWSDKSPAALRFWQALVD